MVIGERFAWAHLPKTGGDATHEMLCAIPALRALRGTAPRAHIALIGLPSSRWVLERFPSYIDELLPFPGFPGMPQVPVDAASRRVKDALDGAVHPAAGNWLYYVNADAAGHLFFTNDEAQFEVAVEKCRANHWGCG